MRRLLEWTTTPSNTQSNGSGVSYKEKFTKILDYHKKHLPVAVNFTEIKKLDDYGFYYTEKKGKERIDFEVAIGADNGWYVYENRDGTCVAAMYGNGFEDLVKHLSTKLVLPNSSTAEYRELVEWVAAKVNNSTDVVYIWNMYIDPRDKGTWCSAEEYNGEYDGSVFKTKEAAYNEAKIHLYELEDEGQLRGDPEDYDIDVIAIPKNKVSTYTLEFSGIN